MFCHTWITATFAARLRYPNIGGILWMAMKEAGRSYLIVMDSPCHQENFREPSTKAGGGKIRLDLRVARLI
jgi:hypothetical protein